MRSFNMRHRRRRFADSCCLVRRINHKNPINSSLYLDDRNHLTFIRPVGCVAHDDDDDGMRVWRVYAAKKDACDVVREQR